MNFVNEEGDEGKEKYQLILLSILSLSVCFSLTLLIFISVSVVVLPFGPPPTRLSGKNQDIVEVDLLRNGS